MTLLNPNANALNLAPSPYAHVLTRVAPNNPLHTAASYSPPLSGIQGVPVPQAASKAVPTPVDISKLLYGLPTLFNIYHG